jgi:hypothetical protein
MTAVSNLKAGITLESRGREFEIHREYGCIPTLFYFALLYLLYEEPGSSGSKVSDYGLDDRAIGVRSPAGAKDFSSDLCVQTGSGAHPASCTMGTRGPFSGGKARPGRDADHSPPSSAEVVNG